MSLVETFSWYLSNFWFTLPLIGFLLWYIFLHLTRQITNEACVHYKGNSRKHVKAVVQGTNIRFKAHSGKDTLPSTVQIKAPPEIMIRGSKTIRVYDVVEGGGETIGFANPLDDASRTAIKNAYNTLEAIKKKGKISEEDVTIAKHSVETILGNLEFENVSTREIKNLNPEVTAAASSISLFERITDFWSSHIQKTRGEIMMMFVYMFIGIAMGFLLGSLLVKMHAF